MKSTCCWRGQHAIFGAPVLLLLCICVMLLHLESAAAAAGSQAPASSWARSFGFISTSADESPFTDLPSHHQALLKDHQRYAIDAGNNTSADGEEEQMSAAFFGKTHTFKGGRNDNWQERLSRFIAGVMMCDKFKLPGLSISIVKGGVPIFQKGFGVRDLNGRNNNDARRVDENTLFGIGSCTKAFTAVAVAALPIDTPVAQRDDLLPRFRMRPGPEGDRSLQVTLRDMLAHRTGTALASSLVEYCCCNANSISSIRVQDYPVTTSCG